MYFSIGIKIIESAEPLVGNKKAETILTQLEGHAKDLESSLASKKAAEIIYKGFNQKLGFFGRLLNRVKCIFNRGDEYISKVDNLYKNIMMGKTSGLQAALPEDLVAVGLRTEVTRLANQVMTISAEKELLRGETDRLQAEIDQKIAEIEEFKKQLEKKVEETGRGSTTSAADVF